MGSPDFAVPGLQKLIASNHIISACFTREAKPKNRGKKLSDTVVAKIAKSHNIAVYTPNTLKSDEVKQKIISLAPDFLVVIAYGLLLPKEILAIPKYGALNLHPSKLPRFRGAAPIQRTIMAGDTETEICIMQMNQKLDEGDILLSQKLIIGDNMTAGELHDKAAIIGADLMLQTIDNYHNIIPQKQSEAGISYAKKITKSETKIDFSKDGKEIINLVRGLNPTPGAYFEDKKNIRYKIFAAEFVESSYQEKLGKITKDFHIFCKNGKITPKIIQKSGHQKMSLEEFIRGQVIFSE